MAKDFPHPLNEFIEEDVPVRKLHYDQDTKKVSSTVKMEKMKTMYVDAKPEKMRCQTGQHNFKIANSSKGLFRCTKCPYYRQVYPTTYMFKKGKLIHKVTGRVV